MKTKILFIIALFFLQIQSAISQCISVEPSIKWETGFDIFREDSIVCIPKLCITYRNNSNTNYYFLKVSNSRSGYPMLPLGSLLQYPIKEYLHPDYLKRAKLHGNYDSQNYKVYIGGTPLYRQGWIIENDTLNPENEHEINMINDDLADIYEYMHRRHCVNNSDLIQECKLYFSITDISPANILNIVKDQFVFLKPGECYVDTYNLIAFKLVGGSFTFCIDKNSLKDYVCTEPIWDKKQSKYVDIHVALPPEVGEYKLYSGDFNTNEIIIQFDR